MDGIVFHGKHCLKADNPQVIYPTNDRARQINPMATPEKQLSELSTKAVNEHWVTESSNCAHSHTASL